MTEPTAPPSQLLSGYHNFRAERFAREEARYRAVADGQQPHTMVIGCADSRVDPAAIFSAGPGELFIVRNVAALAPPYETTAGYHGTSAALEFAVTGLKVSRIVVLGHGLCGGVTAALEAGTGRPVGRFIGPWVDLLAEARTALQRSSTPADQWQKALEQLAIRQSLSNLRSFPFVSEAVADGQLSLHGAWFSIAEGALEWLDLTRGAFHRVSDKA